MAHKQTNKQTVHSRSSSGPDALSRSRTSLNFSMDCTLNSLNTEISASVALLVWMVIEWKLEGKPSLVGVCVGAIAGLATITPAAGFVKPWAAVVIGTASAIFCYACVFGLTKMGYDDALDVWGVHGMGGFLGTCLLGVLAEHDVNGVSGDWNQFKKQLAAALLCAIYSFVVAFALMKGLMVVMDVVPDVEMVRSGLVRARRPALVSISQ